MPHGQVPNSAQRSRKAIITALTRSSVQNAADAVTAAVQTINVTDAVYDTTKFTKSVNLTGTATFDLTKSEIVHVLY
ncbi:MAG: hypothetical protein V8T87_17385 [Victivallales bacterium]